MLFHFTESFVDSISLYHLWITPENHVYSRLKSECGAPYSMSCLNTINIGLCMENGICMVFVHTHLKQPLI